MQAQNRRPEPPLYTVTARARAVMEQELARFPHLETGGLLLGRPLPGQGVAVVEATDPGYENTIREPACFGYDPAYQEHLCQVLSGLYDPPLELVGVWHKHNRRGTRPFSLADERMHRQLMENGGPCLSVLFEKEGPLYGVRVFALNPAGPHADVSAATAWQDPATARPLWAGPGLLRL